VEIPKINTDLGRQLHFVKLPNFLSVETRSVVFRCWATCQTEIENQFFSGGNDLESKPWFSGSFALVLIIVKYDIYSFLPARRYASVGNSDRNVSVRLSVRPSGASIVSKRRKLAA